VGDIVDFWAMSRSIHWTRQQNTVIQKLLKRARHGTRVIFVPGNHDEVLRKYVGTSFGDIELVQEHVHVAADGRRYAVLHGGEFDQITRHHRWVAVLGDVAYNLLVRLNTWLSLGRRTLGISGYWSLAGYAKLKVKSAVGFIYRLRGFGDARGARSRARRRDLRPHSQHGYPRCRRIDVHQLRRLGRQLHGDRRASRRPHGTRSLDRRAAASRRLARRSDARGSQRLLDFQPVRVNVFELASCRNKDATYAKLGVMTSS
jgi:hypothetical protein